MEAESEIYENEAMEGVVLEGFCDFKLLRATAYATIYMASKEGKHFLVKTTKDNSERQLAMLRREYELSIGCSHPYIAYVYTWEECMPVGAGIVMEYIEGRSLAEYVAENPALADRRRIFEELLTAVEYLHKRGIIHNDLKPENILITRADNTLKLIDFGLADNDMYFVLRTLGCTPQYASPELRAQSPLIDARSDIYSIGCLMPILFGSRYGRIARRCRSINPVKRYSDIEHLRRIWMRHRRIPWLLANALIVLLLSGGVLYHKIDSASKIRQYELTQSTLIDSLQRFVEHQAGQEQSLRDERAQMASIIQQMSDDKEQSQQIEQLFTRACQQFESELKELRREAIDSISPIPFYNWTEVIGWEFEERIDACCERYLKMLPIAQRAMFDTFSAPLVTRCKEDVARATWEGGKLYIHQVDSLSNEERTFYVQLIANGEPYRPYVPDSRE